MDRRVDEIVGHMFVHAPLFMIQLFA
jgi:hypothetical protein